MATLAELTAQESELKEKVKIVTYWLIVLDISSDISFFLVVQSRHILY